MVDKTENKTDAKSETTENEDPKAGTQVAVTNDESTDLVSADDDFFDGTGEGLQDFSASDMLVPYVRIIQALSKELQKNHAKYIQGAEQGSFVNSATRKLYDGEKGFYAVPVYFGHRYMAWKPNNGGPAHDYGEDATVYNSLTENEKYKRIDIDGNEVTDSLQFFVYLVNKETHEYEEAVLTFGGSQAKKGRGWSTTIRSRRDVKPNGERFTPNMWFYSYDVTTKPESNDQGSWYGFDVAEGPKVMALTTGREIYKAGTELRKLIASGQVKAAVEDPRGEEEDSTKAF